MFSNLCFSKRSISSGFISLHFVNVTDHFTIVAPHLGSDSRFGTNPVCIAMPTKEKSRPIILDMATSKVAMGKLRVAHNAGELMQEGILISADIPVPEDQSGKLHYKSMLGTRSGTFPFSYPIPSGTYYVADIKKLTCA